jgi:hypothetical protein
VQRPEVALLLTFSQGVRGLIEDCKNRNGGDYTKKYKGYPITDTGVFMVVVMMAVRHGNLP